MQIKIFLKKFIISQYAPSFLMGVVPAVFRSFSFLSEYWLYPLVILAFVSLVRFSIEHNLNLIKEYESLIARLESLDDVLSDTSIRSIVLSLKQPIPLYGKAFFDERGNDINVVFLDLRKSLSKIIQNPYRLLCKGAVSDNREKFKNLVIKNYNLYKNLVDMLKEHNISRSSFNYDKIKESHKDFFSALKTSGTKFKEISQDFDPTCEFFNPLPELKN